jgi:hypothetical protein
LAVKITASVVGGARLIDVLNRVERGERAESAASDLSKFHE